MGIIIDDRLSFDDQVRQCIRKAAYNVNLLKKNAKSLTFETKKMIYYATIKTHFDYCSTIYINCKKEQMYEMQKVQNRALRIILKCEYRTPRKFMLEALGWLSVSQNVKLNVLILIYKIENDLVSSDFKRFLNHVHESHNRNLRNINEFRTPNFRYESTRKSIFYSGVKMFNELPQHIKASGSITKFREECSKHLRQFEIL